MKSQKTLLPAVILVTLFGTNPIQAQTAGASRPLAFEVASIKPDIPDGSGNFRVAIQPQPGGRLTITNANLRMLIRFAYNCDDSQIAGGPAWMDSERYDIVAKGEGNATVDQLREMLGTLLADRFDLKFHPETKELPVYALLIGKNGPKLKPSEDQPTASSSAPANGPRGNRGVMMTRGGVTTQLNGSMSMAQLATGLATSLGRKVIDKTGLQGNYDVKLEWTPQVGEGPQVPGVPGGGGDRGASPDPSVAGIFTAIQEQLGLRLESQKGPVDTIVIDSAAKPKTD
jgi:uncharacterized protein (TIGR03435 family)